MTKNLIIDNYLINTSIYDIMVRCKSELHNGKLRDIVNRGTNVRITCPVHSNGMESGPSCEIYSGKEKDIEYGTFHCLACGVSGNLQTLIGFCFDESEEFGSEWLRERFGRTKIEQLLDLPPIVLNKVDKKYESDIKESDLVNFEGYCQYLEKRKLSKDVCNRFKVKYDSKSKCIIFPVYDENGNFKFVTKRSTINKMFMIPPGVEKPVYLLNYIRENNITDVIVCESQINALYCWTLGYPAIALFGTGTSLQYEILNKSGIRHFRLCFDGDGAGRKGAYRFKNNIRRDVLIDSIEIDEGKDINDYSVEDALKILKVV